MYSQPFYCNLCRIATKITWIEDNVLYLRIELLELWIELIFLQNYSKARISKLEHTDLSIVLDIQYLTLLERILFLLVEFCRNAPGSYCRDCMDAGCHVECCFCRLELLEACLCCMALECCRSLMAGFCCVECLDARGAVAGRCLVVICTG